MRLLITDCYIFSSRFGAKASVSCNYNVDDSELEF